MSVCGFVDFFWSRGNDGSLLSRRVFSMAACFAASGGRARGIESERFRVSTPGQKTFGFDSGFSLRSCQHLLCKRDDVVLSCAEGCAAACKQARGGRAQQRCRAAIACASGYALAAVRVARQAGGSTSRGAGSVHDACCHQGRCRTARVEPGCHAAARSTHHRPRSLPPQPRRDLFSSAVGAMAVSADGCKCACRDASVRADATSGSADGCRVSERTDAEPSEPGRMRADGCD